jgi:hypothetical protein
MRHTLPDAARHGPGRKAVSREEMVRVSAYATASNGKLRRCSPRFPVS